MGTPLVWLPPASAGKTAALSSTVTRVLGEEAGAQRVH
jgi:hypothetical protein